MTNYKTTIVDGLTIRYPAGPLPDAARVAVLKAAFDRVKNAEHWKAPIDTYVTITENAEAEIATILDAIEFYTATSGSARPCGESNPAVVYHITAPGYWAGPAN